MTMMVRAVLEAAANGVLWGLALTAMVAWLLWLLDRTNAGTRFAVWCLTLAAVVALPGLILRAQWPGMAAEIPFDDRLRVPLALWICGAFLMLGRVAWSLLHVRRLRRRATLLSAAPIPVCSSPDVRTPMAVGLTAPMILLPADLAPDLSASEREHIVLHETAHIRRGDHWMNLAQKLAEAVFFFHPGVWWIGWRLGVERESACDDWVVAAAGRAQSYAATLARLVELKMFRRGPMLATAAASSRPQISRRIEMLLDRTRNARPEPATAVVVAALLFLLAGAVWCAHQPPVFAFSGPGEGMRQVRFSRSSFWGCFTLQAAGALEFTEDDRDVRRLSPGGRLTIEERQGLSWRKLAFTERDGRVERVYSVNGGARAFEPEGRAWADEILPRAIRETGLGAAGRVERILKQGGEAAVLAEIARIESDGSRRLYFEELMAHSADAQMFGSILRRAMHEIESDGERRALLSGLLRRGAARGPLAAELLLAAARLHSDGEKAEFLTHAARSYAGDESGRAAFFKVVNSIRSDGERCRVLAELLQRPLGKDDLVRALESAAKMDSDGDKARILAAAADEIAAGAEVRRAWFGAADTLGSDGEHRRALEALLKENGRDRETLVAVIRSAAGIASDGEKAAVLARVGDRCPDDDAVIAPLIEALQTLRSEGEYRRAIAPLVRRGYALHIIRKI